MYPATPEENGLKSLLESASDPGVHTSAAAELAFVLGLVALAAMPFSVMHAVALGTGALGAVFGFIGMASSSRPYVAGSALAPLGLFTGFAVIVVVGMRYLGVETAFGDDLVPTLADWMDDLNSRLPRP